MSESFSEFCPGCGNLLDFPLSSQNVTCNLCAYSRPCKDFEEKVVVIESRPGAFQKYRLIIAGEEDDEHDRAKGAKVKERCPKCGHEEMTFHTAQLRSADEGQTVFYTCLKCAFKFSQNN